MTLNLSKKVLTRTLSDTERRKPSEPRGKPGELTATGELSCDNAQDEVGLSKNKQFFDALNFATIQTSLQAYFRVRTAALKKPNSVKNLNVIGASALKWGHR